MKLWLLVLPLMLTQYATAMAQFQECKPIRTVKQELAITGWNCTTVGGTVAGELCGNGKARIRINRELRIPLKGERSDDGAWIGSLSVQQGDLQCRIIGMTKDRTQKQVVIPAGTVYRAYAPEIYSPSFHSVGVQERIDTGLREIDCMLPVEQGKYVNVLQMQEALGSLVTFCRAPQP